MILAAYRALGLPLLAGAETDFDLFFGGYPDTNQIAVSSALDQAVQSAAGPVFDGSETLFWDPVIGGWTRPSSTEAVNDLREAAGRIAADSETRNLRVDDDGNIVFSDGRPADRSALAQVAGFFGGAASAVGRALLDSPNLMRALTTLGLGAAGLGLGRLAAGEGGTLTLPSQQQGQNPAVAAAQPALTGALSAGGSADLQAMIRANLAAQPTLAKAAAEDIERARQASAQIEAGSAPVRTLALQQLPGQMAGTAPHPSPTYDKATDAVLRQMEMLYGLAPGSLGTVGPPPDPNAPPPGYVSVYTHPRTGERIGVQANGNQDNVDAYYRGPQAPTTGTLVGVTQDPNLPAMQRRLAELVEGGVPGPLQDPVADAMAERVQRAIEGGELDPATERRIREELEVLKNNLKRAYGAPGQEWDNTLGQNLYLKGLESAEALRYGVNRDVINSLAPQEFARRQFTVTNPQQQYLAELGFYGPQTAQRGQLPAAERRSLLSTYLPQVAGNAAFNETARQANVAQGTVLSGLNRPSLAPGATVLGSQWGTFSPTLGINEPSTFPTLANASLAAFQADQNARAATAKSVADIFANSAAALRPSPTLSLAGVTG